MCRREAASSCARIATALLQKTTVNTARPPDLTDQDRLLLADLERNDVTAWATYLLTVRESGAYAQHGHVVRPFPHAAGMGDVIDLYAAMKAVSPFAGRALILGDCRRGAVEIRGEIEDAVLEVLPPTTNARGIYPLVLCPDGTVALFK